MAFWDFSIGDLIPAGISAISSIFGGERQNASNARIMEQQMAFQERMASTQYQRAKADMEAAGLNPMMMFGSGGPAAAPSGSAIPSVNTMRGVPGAISSSLALAKTRAELEVLKTQADKNVADANLSSAGAVRAGAETTLLGEQIPKVRAEFESLDQLTRLRRAEIDQVVQNTNLSGAQQQKIGAELLLLKEQVSIAKHNVNSAFAESRIKEAEALWSDIQAAMTKDHPDETEILAAIRRMRDAITPFR